jgi:hypothetical protein
MARYLNSKDRFDKNTRTIPFESDGIRPIPTRNLYALFNDGGQDLFKHGLSETQPLIGDGEYFTNGSDERGDTTRLSQFESTSDYPSIIDKGKAAKEDPVMFGFDLIIRAEESPLFSSVLTDSVQGFFSSGIVDSTEMKSREKVWLDFKRQFFQFFRKSLETQPSMETDDVDNPTNSRFYYYLTKITGLDGLVEGNTMETTKSFVDYGKDMIKLDFNEDVTLRIGKMAALYKSLYWSRMSGKTLIPENLLRFDCDIIISEVRNFTRIKKVISDDPLGGLQTLRDNTNRYVYSLYECQLFFDKMPHGDVVDLGTQPTTYEGYSMGFTYKHSTMRLDSFNPNVEAYIPLNNGSYDPYGISSFDKFLKTNVPIGSTSSSIPGISIVPTPEIIIDVIKYDDVQIVTNKTNTDSNSNVKQTSSPTSDGMGTDANGALKSKTSSTGSDSLDPAGPPNLGNDIDGVKLAGQINTSIEDLKIAMIIGEIDSIPDISTNNEFKKLNSQISLDELDFYRQVNESPEPTSFRQKNEYNSQEELTKIFEAKSNSTPTSFRQKNDILSKSQLDAMKSGAPKESWLNSDTAGSRFAKRIANTGIAAVNQIVAKRFALLNKTLNKMANNVGYGSMLPPKNIYETSFNGELYLASKMVRDAFENFVGESISSLFNKKVDPKTGK